MTRRAGFTLVELLVVLAILSAMTVVAVRSLAGVQDRTRFEQTQRTLRDVEFAILGAAAAPRSDAFESGFLSDLGRLPRMSADPERPLLELWRLPAGVAANALVADAVDPAVVLSVGWRGPYILLAPGADRLLDGYGDPVRLLPAAGAYAIRSLGADNAPGGAEYDADVSIAVVDSAAGVDRATATVAGQVTVMTAPPGGATWTALVYAYGPDPATGGLKAVVEDADVEPPPAAAPAVFHYRFTGTNALTAGVRALRAYVFPVGAADPRAAAVALGTVSPVLTRRLPNGASNADLTVP